jgi:small subunit ribosomal protein S24e
MKTEIKQQKNNPYLKRKELVVEIENPEESTPSKIAIQQAISKAVNKPVEHIEIIDIMQGKGVSKALARINVWDEKKMDDLSKPKQPAEEAKAE